MFLCLFVCLFMNYLRKGFSQGWLLTHQFSFGGRPKHANSNNLSAIPSHKVCITKKYSQCAFAYFCPKGFSTNCASILLLVDYWSTPARILYWVRSTIAWSPASGFFADYFLIWNKKQNSKCRRTWWKTRFGRLNCSLSLLSIMKSVKNTTRSNKLRSWDKLSAFTSTILISFN